jgi:signal transduction histidine kinase
VSKWSDHYEITVRNRIAKKPKFQSGSRHGIVGMRERLAVVGGTVTASAQGDTWVVHASLPFVDRSRAAATPGLPHKQNESESSTS